MATLVNELLAFSKATSGNKSTQLRPVRLREILEAALHREATGGEQINLACDRELYAQADPDLLQRAVGNILRNALRDAASAGPITIAAESQREEIVLTISDHGPGVPEDLLPKLFDPFFRIDTARTRETGGVGLGLTIAKTCVESCGGTIALSNVAPSGLRVVIRLAAGTGCLTPDLWRR